MVEEAAVGRRNVRVVRCGRTRRERPMRERARARVWMGNATIGIIFGGSLFFFGVGRFCWWANRGGDRKEVDGEHRVLEVKGKWDWSLYSAFTP